MSKIIKPLLNEDGTQVVRKVTKDDWYYLFPFDLHNYYCRKHFVKYIKYRWHSYRFWKIVISDTFNKVCSGKAVKG